MMAKGIIMKALSGFYYVADEAGTITICRGRGKLRHEKQTPLVGDRVQFTPIGDGTGMLDEILPRKNEFYRPAVANMDQLILIVSQAAPVTDPFLIDRVTAIAAARNCDCIICVNKWDVTPGDKLVSIYEQAGFPALRLSAKTGAGIEELRALIQGKISAFTGNTGVGKSSILNALDPEFALATGDISQKLGRGRHTTRHVELFRLGKNALVADTPGFSSFDVDNSEQMRKEELQYYFREFTPYLGQCQFQDCAHGKEKGCAVRQALAEGKIPRSRHESYVRLYEQAKLIPDWKR